MLRLGGVARLDPEPERELSVWRADVPRGAVDDPEETRERLEQHARGDAVIVQLDLFADLVEGDALRRLNGMHVAGLWFHRGRDAENRRHAAEIVADQIDAMHDDLRSRGVMVRIEELAELPIKIELDPELERSL